MVLAVRYSIAKCTPFKLRFSDVRSRGWVAPVQMTVASKSFSSSIGSTFSPTFALQMNLMPSFSMSSIRRSTTSCLSSFMFGMPYISRPPGRSSRSSTVTVWPARLSCAAAASPAGPEPITTTFFPVRTVGATGHDPALFPALVDDGVLDALDRDRRCVDAEHARTLARGRAHAAGELGEVVRLVQPLERFAPQSAVDQIVPLRYQIVDRAAGGHAGNQRAGVAERHAAIHAACGLIAQTLLVHVVMELLPVAHALDRRAVHRELTQILDESSRLAHPVLDLVVSFHRRARDRARFPRTPP